MGIRPNFGLRGKLSIIIILSVFALSAVLTLVTSHYLSSVIDEEYKREAATLTSFLEANMGTGADELPLKHLQFEIEAISRQNPDLKRIAIYAPVGNEIRVVASSSKEAIGSIADENDARPIFTNESFVVEKNSRKSSEVAEDSAETGSGENGLAGNEGAEEKEHRELELLAPLRNSSGQPVAAAGIHLDMNMRDGLIRSQQINFTILTNLGLLALLLILYLSLNRMIVHPVKKLTAATRYIGHEDWKPIEGISRQDEIGDLSMAFNEVAGSLKTRDGEVELLVDASIAVSSTLHVDKILQILSQKISSSPDVTYCRISLLDRSNEELVVKSVFPATGMSDFSHEMGERLSLSEAVLHDEVIRSGEARVMRKETSSSLDMAEREWEWAMTSDTRSALFLPLISKEETIGVVTLGQSTDLDESPISNRKVKFYQTLMNQAVVAIQNAQFYEQTEWQVRELSAMHNMSQAFTSTLDYQQVISVVAQRVGNLIGAQFASVLLPDEQGRHLEIVADYNLSADYIWTINEKRRIPIGVGPVGRAFSTRRPRMVTNVLTDADYSLWKHIASAQGYSSLIALPLLSKNKSIGVLCIYFEEPRRLKEDEIGLLTTSANEAAIAIENARIYENLQDAFVGTIRSLAETIDAKDAYTRGHSERVSLYAEAIARNLGLGQNELETIRYAGYLHDVGKIGIPDAILSKPGRLTVEEFSIIKKHPVISEKILEPVNFPFPVQSIVRHHHERFDGNGYPDGLSGEEIPLGARILLVADAYEAMTSDRPYRKGLSANMALAELAKNKSAQFDPRIVDVFTGIIRTESSSRQEVRLRA